MDLKVQNKIAMLLGYEADYRAARAHFTKSENRTLKIGEYDMKIYLLVLQQ
jgi:hypothetical protein